MNEEDIILNIFFEKEHRPYGIAVYLVISEEKLRIGGFKNEKEAIEYITQKLT